MAVHSGSPVVKRSFDDRRAERARQLLDDDTDSRFTPEAQAHRRRALEEYLAPDPATTGVPGLAR